MLDFYTRAQGDNENVSINRDNIADSSTLSSEISQCNIHYTHTHT